MVHKVKVGGHNILYLFDFVRRGFWEVCLLITHEQWTCSLPLRWVFCSHHIATTGFASTLWWFVVHFRGIKLKPPYRPPNYPVIWNLPHYVGRNHDLWICVPPQVPAATWKSSIVASLGPRLPSQRLFFQKLQLHLKNISQNGSLRQEGVNINNIWVATT